MSRKVTITLTDEQADVLDAVAFLDDLPRQATGAVKLIVAHACVMALRERVDVAALVESRRRPLASVHELREAR